MALNKQVFKTRALTALIFVIVMLGGVLWNIWSFSLLFTIIHFGCWYEFVKLMKKTHGNKDILHSLAGFIYISLPIILMLSLWNIPVTDNSSLKIFGSTLPCAIMFSLWTNDTMAYLVGSFIGKTPFSKISPKKTWEGTLGGVILCVVAMGLLGPLLFPVLAAKHWVAIAAICAIFGTAGDLLESKIKRMADVKDSGSIMPGHGGFLDRFDSLLVATPFVWLYVKLFIQ